MWKWVAGKIAGYINYPKLVGDDWARVNVAMSLADKTKECKKCGMLYVYRSDSLFANYIITFGGYDFGEPVAPRFDGTIYCPLCRPDEQQRNRLAEWARENPTEAAACKLRKVKKRASK